MKKYYLLIIALIALCVDPMSAQRTRGGGVRPTFETQTPIITLDNPPPKTPVGKEPVLVDPIGPIDPIDPIDPIGPTGSNDRTVVWVHGLEGSGDSWNRYADKFQGPMEFKMRSYRTKYPDITSVSQGAQKAQDDIINVGHVVPSNNNIFIAHSMGGLVTREIDRQRTNSGQSELFGGFVTFSTPHRGAALANSVVDGKADQFADDAVQSLVAPFYDTWVGALLLSVAVVNDRVQLIRRIMPRSTAVGELTTNSSFITGINSFSHGDKKIITVAARESGEKLWRELSSLFLHAPSKISLHTYGDDALPEAMNFTRGAYNGAGIVSAAIAVVCVFKFNPVGAVRWTLRSVFFFKGASWIKNAPKVFDNLAGANRIEQRQVTSRAIRQDIIDRWMTWMDDSRCESRPRIDCSFNRFIGTLSQADRNNLYETVTSWVNVPVINEENDGIILKSSSNGLSNSPNVKTIETRLRTDFGVNHQECMNHEFITEIFYRDIFSGSQYDFFLVEKRYAGAARHDRGWN